MKGFEEELKLANEAVSEQWERSAHTTRLMKVHLRSMGEGEAEEPKASGKKKTKKKKKANRDEL